MRKFLITGASVLLLGAPAFAQSISTETTTTKETTESVAPAPMLVQPVPVPVPAVPGTSSVESRSSVTQSGESGVSRTDRRSDTYIGVDGAVHKDQTIRHEEQR